MSWIWPCFKEGTPLTGARRGRAVPAEAVCERGGSRKVALPVHGAAVAAGAEGPEGCGRAWQVQADVPKRVYRRGNAARRGTGKDRMKHR